MLCLAWWVEFFPYLLTLYLISSDLIYVSVQYESFSETSHLPLRRRNMELSKPIVGGEYKILQMRISSTHVLPCQYIKLLENTKSLSRGSLCFKASAERGAIIENSITARDSKVQYHLATDASLSGFRESLFQLVDEEPDTRGVSKTTTERVVMFSSYSLTATQSWWHTFEHEEYVVIKCLEEVKWFGGWCKTSSDCVHGHFQVSCPAMMHTEGLAKVSYCILCFCMPSNL